MLWLLKHKKCLARMEASELLQCIITEKQSNQTNCGRPWPAALYKLQSKYTSNSGFDQTFMPCSGYILFAAEQRVGYQISWVDLQREVNCP